jgi:hypothetical protein
VKMSDVGAKGAGQRQDFEVAGEKGRLVYACVTQVGHAQAKNALHHERGSYGIASRDCLKGGTQIVAGNQAYWK